MKKRIVRREVESELTFAEGILGRIFASRGVREQADLDYSLKLLLPPNTLKDIDRAASILGDCVEQDSKIVIVGDFDADGATSCALMVSVLSAMGSTQTNYLVPDRFKFGYGLTPEIVEVAMGFEPRLLVTVDNGIASVDGVDRANQLGLEVIVTDHHLPGETLPNAAAIVNPNQQGCLFPGKSTAGVGVAFYLLSATRSLLRSRGWFETRAEPNLAEWLDLVALGTIADVVPLDRNNRRLVTEGIRRIRAGRSRPGLYALLEVAGLDRQFITTRDLAFSIAPRLNAAGRLQDMSVGIECLLADEQRAAELAMNLDQLNTERKEIEADMRDEALAHLSNLSLDAEQAAGLCFYQKDWHQGIVGILAARVKERSHRPVIAFAKVNDEELKGSGRSVAGFHMRDALNAIATRHPGMLLKFGGHAMAAGLSLKETDLNRFRVAFDEEVVRALGRASIEQVVMTDGEISEPITTELARQIEEAAPWGQGFPEPEFDGKFEILEQRIVGGRHLKMLLQPEHGPPVDAIYFNQATTLDNRHVHCAYRLEINRFRGRETPQLVVSLTL